MGDLSPHFSRSEFACKCGCGWANPHPHLVSQLEMLRAWANLEPNFEFSISITSGGRCPKHHAEVTRCRWCEGSGKRLQYHTTLSGTSSGIWKCPDCQGTGSTSPESYHLPRLWGSLYFGEGGEGWRWYLWNVMPEDTTFEHEPDGFFSLAADFQIMRREQVDGRLDVTKDEPLLGWSPPILDLAAMRAMTAFWELIWQGGWHLYESWIHCDPGPKRRW